MYKFEIGDSVKIRKDLVEGNYDGNKEYDGNEEDNGVFYNPFWMDKYQGRIARITERYYCSERQVHVYRLNINEFDWSESMLELAKLDINLITKLIEDELQSTTDQINSLTEKRLHLLKQLEILKEGDE
jgi:hypothetical protein